VNKFGFCIGNGESRKNFNLLNLKPLGEIYGSNAVHRDNDVDYLVCCDRRMVSEVLLNNYTKPVYTRQDWLSEFRYPNVNTVPSLPWKEEQKWTQTFHMGSGLHAVHLAIKQGCNWIVMIGHDMQKNDGKHNNIYKDTHNYESTDHHAIDPSFWIQQFELFFITYPKCKFMFVNDEWESPFEKEYENVSFQTYQGFENDINQS
jgi:hypothetical protein